MITPDPSAQIIAIEVIRYQSLQGYEWKGPRVGPWMYCLIGHWVDTETQRIEKQSQSESSHLELTNNIHNFLRNKKTDTVRIFIYPNRSSCGSSVLSSRRIMAYAKQSLGKSMQSTEMSHQKISPARTFMRSTSSLRNSMITGIVIGPWTRI